MSLSMNASGNKSELMTLLFQYFDKITGGSRFSDKSLEFVYASGYRYFANEKYDKAAEIFSMLCAFRPLNVKYLTAFAICWKRLKQYDLALTAFNTLSLLEPENTVPVLHTAECYLAKGETETAAEILQILVEDDDDFDAVLAEDELGVTKAVAEMLGAKPSNPAVKQRAALLLAGLSRRH